MVAVVVDRDTAVHSGPSQFERLESPVGRGLQDLLVVDAEVVDSATSLFGRLVEEACRRGLMVGSPRTRDLLLVD